MTLGTHLPILFTCDISFQNPLSLLPVYIQVVRHVERVCKEPCVVISAEKWFTVYANVESKSGTRSS